MSEQLRNLPADSPVLVYRTKQDKLEGTFKLISEEGEKRVVEMKNGRRIFHRTRIKPYTESLLTPEGKKDHNDPAEEIREE